MLILNLELKHQVKEKLEEEGVTTNLIIIIIIKRHGKDNWLQAEQLELC